MPLETKARRFSPRPRLSQAGTDGLRQHKDPAAPGAIPPSRGSFLPIASRPPPPPRPRGGFTPTPASSPPPPPPGPISTPQTPGSCQPGPGIHDPPATRSRAVTALKTLPRDPGTPPRPPLPPRFPHHRSRCCRGRIASPHPQGTSRPHRAASRPPPVTPQSPVPSPGGSPAPPPVPQLPHGPPHPTSPAPVSRTACRPGPGRLRDAAGLWGGRGLHRLPPRPAPPRCYATPAPPEVPAPPQAGSGALAGDRHPRAGTRWSGRAL